MQDAWKRFFDKKKAGTLVGKARKGGKLPGMPRFKKKGRSLDSFYIGGDHIKVRGRYLHIPKLGWVKMAEALPYGGHINSATISHYADRWMVSFQCDVEYSFIPVKNQDRVGIDVGINALVTASDGQVWTSPNPFAAAKRKLARRQRWLPLLVNENRRATSKGCQYQSQYLTSYLALFNGSLSIRPSAWKS